MRVRDEFPLDPEIATTLEAIDTTLAGDPVDPSHADLAELALLLAADKPVIEEGFARLLDQQVKDRAKLSAVPRTGRPSTLKKPRRRAGRWWVWAPASAVAMSLLAAVVIVASEGRGGSSAAGAFGTTATPRAPRAFGTLQQQGAPRTEKLIAKPEPPVTATTAQLTGVRHHSSASSSAAASAGFGANNTLAPAPEPLSPPTHGRKIIQGAQLSLMTSPQRVDQVSQEVYDVVGQQNGIVKSSSVTANGGRGGYAQFQLSIPSSNLARTMSSLSTLPFAHVVSRTDNTQDVTNTYRVDQQRLNDARALHTSLLKQLANAITQAQIDSIQARIRDDEGAIAADQSALNSLQRSIGYSQINLQINSGSIPVPVKHGGDFTLSRAVHDAGRVLTVAAGVSLIVLAALLPIGLLLALLWWIRRTARRRSRLHALDLT